MATRAAHKRLVGEYKAMQADPPPYIVALPDEADILEWHYLITGPPDTPYEGGQYHGTVVFPAEYPFKPPAIRMTTPSGRFKCDVRLCLSISDYHPKTWNPAWSISTILTGLLSFMVADDPTAGSINTSEAVKRELAAESRAWNARKNPKFRKHFPEEVAKFEKEELEKAEAMRNAPKDAPAPVVAAAVQEKKTALKQNNLREWFSGTSLFCAIVVIFGWMVAARIME